MKAISTRLGKLEHRLGLGPETEDQRRLRERLESARRRLSEWRRVKDYRWRLNASGRT